MRFHLLISAVAICLGLFSIAASGGVVVVADRMASKIDFFVVKSDETEQKYSLKPQDVVSIPTADSIKVRFDARGEQRRYTLKANSIYYFAARGDASDLIEHPMPAVEIPAAAPAAKANDKIVKPQADICTVTVKLLADQNEPATQKVWEKRFRDRMKEASDIFEQSCRVRFEVVAVDTWEKNNSIIDFNKSAADFETKVSSDPARLAIGFTSHFRKEEGRVHMGGTRGPLRRHILIREWPQYMSNAERLEILVHELGHFLGAGHIADADSVMRPVLGDRKANALEFRIGLDPVNTLIAYLVGEQLRTQPVSSLTALPPPTKAVLISAYKDLAASLPDDPVCPQYISILESSVPKKTGAGR
jgi:hypothetical protein